MPNLDTVQTVTVPIVIYSVLSVPDQLLIDNVVALRCFFSFIFAILIAAHFALHRKIRQKNDLTPVIGNDGSKTTAVIHDAGSQPLVAPFVAVGLVSVLHFLVGVRRPLLMMPVIQSLMFWRSPCVKIYFYGWTEADSPLLKRPFRPVFGSGGAAGKNTGTDGKKSS